MSTVNNVNSDVVTYIQIINQAGMNIESLATALSTRDLVEALEYEGVEFNHSVVYKLIVKEIIEAASVIGHFIEELEGEIGIDTSSDNLEKVYELAAKSRRN